MSKDCIHFSGMNTYKIWIYTYTRCLISKITSDTDSKGRSSRKSYRGRQECCSVRCRGHYTYTHIHKNFNRTTWWRGYSITHIHIQMHAQIHIHIHSYKYTRSSMFIHIDIRIHAHMPSVPLSTPTTIDFITGTFNSSTFKLLLDTNDSHSLFPTHWDLQ